MEVSELIIGIVPRRLSLAPLQLIVRVDFRTQTEVMWMWLFSRHISVFGNLSEPHMCEQKRCTASTSLLHGAF